MQKFHITFKCGSLVENTTTLKELKSDIYLSITTTLKELKSDIYISITTTLKELKSDIYISPLQLP